jgi:hypothetical protein
MRRFKSGICPARALRRSCRRRCCNGYELHTVTWIQGAFMTSEHLHSFGDDHAGCSSLTTAPFLRRAGTVPATVRATQPWVQAAEAVIDWYAAMFRLAFGLGRPSHAQQAQSPVTAPAAPQAADADAMPVAPQPRSSAVVKLRPKGRKSRPAANSSARSSKISTARRRRAA